MRGRLEDLTGYRGLVLGVAILAVSCRTVPLTPRPVISVPNGLNANDVEVAILYALAKQPIPPDLTPGEKMADNALKALFLFRYQKVDVGPRERGWFAESAEPGVIFAGYEDSPYYLRVAIRYDDTKVQLDIVESQNLEQTETRIHKSAIRWTEDLESTVRRSLGQLAIGRRLQSGGPPR